LARKRLPIVILGAGPAGLGAAFQLARRGCFEVTIVERGPVVGGNAGSFDIDSLRVDYGSHRLHPSCAPAILADIREMLGDDLLDRPRHGRIRLRGHWVHFPLKPANLVRNLPPSFMTGVAIDMVRKSLTPNGHGGSFEAVLEHGLGRTICRDFYFPYARKIWGLEPEALDAEQARRRVSAGSMGKMVRKVLSGVSGVKKPGAGRFFYPRQGFGSISEAYASAARQYGATLRVRTSVSTLHVESGRVSGVTIADESGREELLPARHVFSTIPATGLVRIIRPHAPAAVVESAGRLQYRAMILIYLVLDTDQFTEYDAHYFPDSDVQITRLSEPKNYGLAAAPGRTVLCAELPCSQRDAVWTATDDELGRVVGNALAAAELPVRSRIRAVTSRRLPYAYPIYTRGYGENFDRIDAWLGEVGGLLTLGRQGLFAHDNTHHALAMAYAANECLHDEGTFDNDRWRQHREAFRQHVVED
jgi:protoporphyrinogen oxidase